MFCYKFDFFTENILKIKNALHKCTKPLFLLFKRDQKIDITHLTGFISCI